jgi:hypothetical protein
MESGADLGTGPPGPITHAESVDLNRLVVDPDHAAVTTGLIEVPSAESVRFAESLVGEMDLDLLAILVHIVDLVPRERLEAFVVDPVLELDVDELLVFGDREMPKVFVVEAVVELGARVVPQDAGTRRDALILPEEGIDLSGELAFRDCEGEPASLGPEGIIARRGVEMIVGVHVHVGSVS